MRYGAWAIGSGEADDDAISKDVSYVKSHKPFERVKLAIFKICEKIKAMLEKKVLLTSSLFIK